MSAARSTQRPSTAPEHTQTVGSNPFDGRTGGRVMKGDPRPSMSPRSTRTVPSLSVSTSMDDASDKALPDVPNEMGVRTSVVFPDSARTLPTSWRAPSHPKSPSLHLTTSSSQCSDLFSPSMRSTRQPYHHANASNDSTPTNASFPRYRYGSDHPSTSVSSVPLEDAPVSSGPVGLKKKPSWSGRKMLGMSSKRASSNPVASPGHAKKPSALLGRLPSVMRRNASDNDLGTWNRRKGKMARTPSSSALNDSGGSVGEEGWEKVDKRVMTKAARRDPGLDADQEIGLPFNVEHDLHVSHTLDGLPPPWVQTLRDQGLSDQDLMLITAANRRRHASTVPLATLPREVETPNRRSPLLAPPLEGLKTDHRERMKMSASPDSPKTAAPPISPTAAPSAWATLKGRSRSNVRLSVSVSGGSSPQKSPVPQVSPVAEKGPRLSLQLQDFRQLKIIESEEGSDWASGLLAALGERGEQNESTKPAPEEDNGQDGELRSPSSAKFSAKRIPVPRFLDEPRSPMESPLPSRAPSPQPYTAPTPLAPPPLRALNQRRQSKQVDVPIALSPRNSLDGQSFGIPVERSSDDSSRETLRSGSSRTRDRASSTTTVTDEACASPTRPRALTESFGGGLLRSGTFAPLPEARETPEPIVRKESHYSLPVSACESRNSPASSRSPSPSVWQSPKAETSGRESLALSTMSSDYGSNHNSAHEAVVSKAYTHQLRFLAEDDTESADALDDAAWEFATQSSHPSMREDNRDSPNV